MSVLFRDYTSADLGPLFDLDQLCFEPAIAYTRREMEHFVSHPDSFTILADTGSYIAGFLIIHQLRPRLANVITIDVHPRHRQEGIATDLMRRGEARLLGRGIDKITLEVAVNNHPAQKFYEKLGYRVLRTLPKYYPGLIDGLRMGKLLGRPAASRPRKKPIVY